MTNSDYIRQLSDDSLARALVGTFTRQYCTSPNPLECDHEWDEELDCSCCVACAYRWLRKERHDEH